MDSEKVKKKFFDVTPPASTPAVAPSAPAVPRRQMIAVSDTNDTSVADDPLLDSKGAQIHKAVDIAPLSSAQQEETVAAKVTKSPDAAISPAAEESAPEETLPEEPLVEATPEVAAPSEAAKEPSAIDAPTVEPLPETVVETATDTMPETVVAEDKETHVPEQYVATDALPDPSETAAKNLQSSMQEPKIYDTTAYHIPIKNAGHGHGGVKMAFLFGALFAIIVVGGVVYAMVQLGSK